MPLSRRITGAGCQIHGGTLGCLYLICFRAHRPARAWRPAGGVTGGCTHTNAHTRPLARAQANEPAPRGASHFLGMACRARGSARWMGQRANLGGARAAAARVRVFMCLVMGMASVRGLSYQGEVRVCELVCRRVRVDCAYTQSWSQNRLC